MKQSEQEARRRIEELKTKIRTHDRFYYAASDPQITDQAYDALARELKDLEESYPQFKTNDSPTQRVSGGLQDGFKVVTHKQKMLSLDNTYSIEEVKEWERRIKKIAGDRKITYVVELKMDGVSASLTFRKGLFVQGATRGDGERGEDITANLKAIRGFPVRLRSDFPADIEARAEIYMDKEEFAKINGERQKSGENLFANPRNAASGSLKLLDPNEVRKRNLKYFVHSCGDIAGAVIKTQEEFLNSAHRWGLCVNDTHTLCKDLEEAIAASLSWQERRDTLPYEVDGMVIKVNDWNTQELLGTTLKSPRWAVAYKFPGRQAVTVLKGVVVQVGRTGVLTPVAELEPVPCGGVTISHATLHNFDEIERLQVRVGDRVLVERAGDVIPKIVKALSSQRTGKERKIEAPHQCPVCKSEVFNDEKEVALRCINPDCPAQLKRSLLHFASRQAMDIEGMGDVVVEALVDRKMVASIADIYTLTADDFLKLPLFARKKAESLVAAITASKAQALRRFLFGLGIRHIGRKAASELARSFSLDALFSAAPGDLAASGAVGAVAAKSVNDFFRQKSVRLLIDKLKRAGLAMAEPAAAQRKKGELSGKKIVFTGVLRRFSREEAQQLARAHGAQVTENVSKKTDYLVAGEEPGSKLNKAETWGVTVIDEQAFLRLIGKRINDRDTGG